MPFFFSCKNNQVRFNSKSRFKNTRICFERRQRIVAWIAAIVAGKSIGVWAQRLCIDSSHSFFQFFELGRLHCSKNSTGICTASAWRHRRAVFWQRIHQRKSGWFSRTDKSNGWHNKSGRWFWGIYVWTSGKNGARLRILVCNIGCCSHYHWSQARCLFCRAASSSCSTKFSFLISPCPYNISQEMYLFRSFNVVGVHTCVPSQL